MYVVCVLGSGGRGWVGGGGGGRVLGGVYMLPSYKMFVFQLKLTPLTELSRIPWIAAHG